MNPTNKTTVDFWFKLKSKTSTKVALLLLLFWILVVIFSPLLSNDRPIFAIIKGQQYWPAVESLFLGPDQNFRNWYSQEYEKVVWPLIPYASSTLDTKNSGCIGPFESQHVASNRWRHWLGTDMVGRDVAAGIVRGASVALIVGLGSVLLAGLIGVFIGSIAGFYGDHGLRISYLEAILGTVFLIVFSYQWFAIGSSWKLLLGHHWFWFLLLITILEFLFLRFLAKGADMLFSKHSKRSIFSTIALPLDLAIMRLIEIQASLPGLLILLALIGVIVKPNESTLFLVIGLLAWPPIARFTRAELLRIRALGYTEAGKSLGLSDWHILFKHAVPNAMGPILVTLSFTVASAILLESYLSFLGLGLATEDVTWGSLMQNARQYFRAWWLAVFPGIAILGSILIFNHLGESLLLALEGSEKNTDF